MKKPKSPKAWWVVLDCEGDFRGACRIKRDAEDVARKLNTWSELALYENAEGTKQWAPYTVAKYVLAEGQR